MTSYVALLRAVNVGRTGRLSMAELKKLCHSAGFGRVHTYIASGNVVFESEADEAAVKAAFEAKLLAFAGKPVGVIVRTGTEMAAVLKDNPFPDAASNRTVAIFLDQPPPADASEHATGLNDEEMRVGTRGSMFTTAAAWGIPSCDSRRQPRHRAQYEHGRQACRDGVDQAGLARNENALEYDIDILEVMARVEQRADLRRRKLRGNLLIGLQEIEERALAANARIALRWTRR